MSSHQNFPYQSAFGDVDESFKVNRWASGPSDDGVQNYFMRYTSGQESSRQQDTHVAESNRRFNTQITYSNYADKFKKMKYNQMQTLKQLRQQYEILRNLPLQDEFLRHSHHKKQNSSDYSSQHEAQSSSSSSHQAHKKKIREAPKENQVLSMQKRQLELVIGNSMRKIEELLNNQVQYKKIIHELQIQLDSRNSEQKVDNLTKVWKKNQADLNEKIQNLRRDIERLKLINQQLLEKSDSLQAELNSRNQDLKKCRDEKRILEDSIRSQKDKYMNLQIQIKRVKMEFSVLQKDKNNEINRLKAQLQSQVNIGPSSAELKRLQDDLRSQKYKYQTLLNQFQSYKRQVINRPKQVITKEVVRDNRNEDQLKIFQTLINHLRQDSANQSRATMDLISSMVLKIDQKNSRQKQNKNKKREKEKPEPPKIMDQTTNKLLQEMFNLRNQVTSIKRDRQDPNKSRQYINNLSQSMANYERKIRKLQEQIADGSISKQNLLKQYEIIKSTFEYSKQQCQKLQVQNRRLKDRIGQLQNYGQNSSQQLKNSFKQRESQYQQTIRLLKRQLDQALYTVQKFQNQEQFNVKIVREQLQARIILVQQKASRSDAEKEVLRQELNKMRSFYEQKIKQKNIQIQRTAQQYALLCEGKQKALTQFKSRSEAQLITLVQKIEGIASLNQRYLLQSNQLQNAQRQLHELRYAIRKMKGMNEGVDHLWQIKQTQYLNLHELLKQIRIQ